MNNVAREMRKQSIFNLSLMMVTALSIIYKKKIHVHVVLKIVHDLLCEGIHGNWYQPVIMMIDDD